MGTECSRIASLCFVLALFMGCGRSATILKRDYRIVEGEIVSAGPTSLYVETQQGEVRIPRDQILDIDHPGNAAATFGVVLTAYGAANIAIGLPKCDKHGAAFCTGVFMPAVLGLVLTTYGLSVWGGSRGAMNRDFRGRKVKLSGTFVSPAYLSSEHGNSPGLVLSSSF